MEYDGHSRYQIILDTPILTRRYRFSLLLANKSIYVKTKLNVIDYGIAGSGIQESYGHKFWDLLGITE